MARKFTEEQLSRILSHAHELTRGGDFRVKGHCPVGCVNQAAYNVDHPGAAYKKNIPAAERFDTSSYIACPVGLLRMLESIGAS